MYVRSLTVQPVVAQLHYFNNQSIEIVQVPPAQLENIAI